jgi:hypothetical protein
LLIQGGYNGGEILDLSALSWLVSRCSIAPGQDRPKPTTLIEPLTNPEKIRRYNRLVFQCISMRWPTLAVVEFALRLNTSRAVKWLISDGKFPDFGRHQDAQRGFEIVLE